jgi:hypothetical protein
MSEHDGAAAESTGGTDIKSVKKPFTQTKHVSWSGDAESSGSGAMGTDSTSDDLFLGELSTTAKATAKNGSPNGGSAEGVSTVDALWTDEILLSSSKPAGTLETFTLELDVGNPKTVGGGIGSKGSLYGYSLAVGALLEDITGTTYGLYFERYSAGGNQGNPGINKLKVRLPVGTAVGITGVVNVYAQAAAPDKGDSATVTVELDDAHVCLLPPTGVTLMSASGHAYSRC